MKDQFFIVANCRGKKPIITDVKKTIRILSSLKQELNDCKAKRMIDGAEFILTAMLKEDNPDVVIFKKHK